VGGWGGGGGGVGGGLEGGVLGLFLGDGGGRGKRISSSPEPTGRGVRARSCSWDAGNKDRGDG